MKFKIQAGTEIEVATRREVREEIEAAGTAWRGELARGLRWRTASMLGTVSAAGALTLGDSGDQWIGPPQGMVWACKRISVSASYTPATQALSLYRGSVSDTALIIPDLSGYDQLYDEPLRGGERLVVAAASGLTNGAQITVTVLAREAPEFLAWRL